MDTSKLSTQCILCFSAHIYLCRTLYLGRTLLIQCRPLTHHYSRFLLEIQPDVSVCTCACMYTCMYVSIYLPTYLPISFLAHLCVLSIFQSEISSFLHYHNQHQSQSAGYNKRQLQLFILQVSLLVQFCFVSSHGAFAAFIPQNPQLGLFFLQLRVASHKSRLQTYHFQMSHLDIITAVIFSRFCIIAHLSLPDVYKVSVDHLSYYLPRA